MQLKRSILFAVAGALALAGQTVHAVVDFKLFEVAINIDGTVSTPTVSLDSAYQTTISGAGVHHIDLFVDVEIDQDINTYFNETGSTSGSPVAGQSWEIDEPGWFDGDIYENFQGSVLDNQIGVSIYGNTTFPDDVSMALGWDFDLALDQTAYISFLLSTKAPANGFYLIQTDPGSPASIYFSSSLDIRGTGQEVPLPATLLLIAAGALGMGRFAPGARR